MTDQIIQKKKSIELLKSKLAALEKLNGRILDNPKVATEAIAEYQSSVPQDELDADFRWRDHVQKIGGINNLPIEQRDLLLKEVQSQPTPNMEIFKKSMIGFGLARKEQGRPFAALASLDAVIAGGLIYSMVEPKSQIGFPLFVFGLIPSRCYQYIDAANYDMNQKIDLQNLRTDRKPEPFGLSIAFEFP